MPARPLVIIHGWSDTSSSFRRLARLVNRRTGRPVTVIDLADYKSMDDEVTFDDLTAAMQNAWKAKRLPTTRRSVDAIVHSTGGLVVRDWLQRNFRPQSAPVHRLVMLAPANFGSPLAHKGRSMIGRVVKGWGSEKRFQTGEKILKGLELASPYSWNLAMEDVFGTRRFHGKGRVLTTVLVGNKGYGGISSVANESGSDGTVRVSTANLNGAHFRVEFDRNPKKPRVAKKIVRNQVAFGVVDRENHSTIAAKDDGPVNSMTLDLIASALSVQDAGYDALRRDLAEMTRRTMVRGKGDSYTHGYQNTVVRVVDDFGNSVKEYFLEFYIDDEDASWFEEFFHRDAIRKVHAYGDDASYRSVYVDCTTLHHYLDKPTEAMKMSLTAMPEFRENGNVGYLTFTDKDIGGIDIGNRMLKELFQENRTVLMEIVLKRQQSPDVFRIRPLARR